MKTESRHSVQFYNEYPATDLADYAAKGLRENEGVILILRKENIPVIREFLPQAQGFENAGQLMIFSAQETLVLLSVDGRIDQSKSEFLTELIAWQTQKFGKVRVYGEMVDILAERRDFKAMIALETEWNRIIGLRPIRVHCAYDISRFENSRDLGFFEAAACCHDEAIHANAQGQNDHLMAQRDELIERMRHKLNAENIMSVLGHLCAEMAHDIRSPLAIVRSNVDLILENSKIDRAATANTIYNSLDMISGIVNRTLTLARGSITDPQPVNLSAVVSDTFLMIRSALQRSGIELSAEVEDGLFIMGDAKALQQALLNLILNARDGILESGEGGSIVVSLAKEEAVIELEVRDDGQGLNTAALKAIQKPGFSTKSDGHGLGLQIVREIINEVGGSFECESDPGRCTKMRMMLPALQESPQAL